VKNVDYMQEQVGSLSKEIETMRLSQTEIPETKKMTISEVKNSFNREAFQKPQNS
jgi:prefoldin subunit 5